MFEGDAETLPWETRTAATTRPNACTIIPDIIDKVLMPLFCLRFVQHSVDDRNVYGDRRTDQR